MGKLSQRGREKKLQEKAGWRARRSSRPARPGLDFTSRAVRRASIVGKIPGWRAIWFATRGWPDLVAQFAEGVAQRAEAAKQNAAGVQA